MHAFYGSGGDDAELDRRITELMASVSRIGADRDLDLVPTSRYLYVVGRGGQRRSAARRPRLRRTRRVRRSARAPDPSDAGGHQHRADGYSADGYSFLMTSR